jgi:hypothetical protein
MDDAYCVEMNKELADFHARQAERRRQEAEAASKPKKGRR